MISKYREFSVERLEQMLEAYGEMSQQTELTDEELMDMILIAAELEDRERNVY